MRGIWGGIRKALVVLKILNDTGVVKVKETDALNEIADIADREIVNKPSRE